MLKEVSARDPETGRRWFASELADLYVWQNNEGEVDSFEYCYRVRAVEFSARWHSRKGFEHARIDDGEASPLKNDTPIAMVTIAPNWKQVTKHFRAQGRVLDPALYQFILHKLHQAYCGGA